MYIWLEGTLLASFLRKPVSSCTVMLFVFCDSLSLSIKSLSSPRAPFFENRFVKSDFFSRKCGVKKFDFRAKLFYWENL